jgi:hypothetical protein
MRKGILIFTILFLQGLLAKADLANDLLKASDEARGGAQEGLTWKIEIETKEDGEVSKREFLVKTRDVDAHVEALSPARNKGEIYLINDRTMWFFKPSLKKPVAISARQKLSGQAANGDIASTNYSRDYTPTLEKTEVIAGDKVQVLLLKAKANNLTYDQIRYWISEKTKRAIKADFLTLQGRVFKSATMEYKNKVKVHGRNIDFVSKMTIVDASFANNRSVITYFDTKIGSNPASLFNVNNLSR